MRLCIVNGYIISPGNNLTGNYDLWIDGGRILQIEKNGRRVTETGEADVCIDAAGKWVLPGFIDLHVHFREPGQTHKEDMESGCAAAAAGGFTTVCCMPNTDPPIDSPASILYADAKGRDAKGARAFVLSSITKGQQGKELADYSSMINLNTRSREFLGRGLAGITEDGRTVEDRELMRQAMIAAKKLGVPVFDHAEPEFEIVEREIRLVEETGCPVHFCHISRKECVEKIREARKAGLPITAETAPHYVVFNDRDVSKNTNRKMNPPIGKEEDRQAILKGIADGTIQAIATDHAPHHPDEKRVVFEQAPNGVIGLETSFAACYTYLVKTGVISVEKLLSIMSVNPAEILGFDRGIIGEGKAADLTVVDPDREWTVAEEGFESKAVNTPFAGMTLWGKVTHTIVDGDVMYKEEKGEEPIYDRPFNRADR